MNRKSSNSSLVWSSELGRVCPGCGKAASACSCRKQPVQATGDGIVRVRRETKGRGGKTVTVVTGLAGSDESLKELAAALKRRCGTGGAVKDGTVEIQGDHCDLIVAELTQRGMKVKRAGG